MLKVSSVEAQSNPQVYQVAGVEAAEEKLSKKNHKEGNINSEIAFGSGAGVLEKAATKFSRMSEKNVMNAVKHMENPFAKTNIANENIFAGAAESISGLRKSSPVHEIPVNEHGLMDAADGIEFEKTLTATAPIQLNPHIAAETPTLIPTPRKKPMAIEEDFTEIIPMDEDYGADTETSKQEIQEALRTIRSQAGTTSPISILPQAKRDENGKLLSRYDFRPQANK
jgi:hypothetical protein